MKTSRWSQDLYQTAYEFAADAHNEQKIPGTNLPYITHVSLVSMELLAAGMEAEDIDFAMQCSLLHDVLEDTAVTFALLELRFGTEIARAVQALTKDRSLPKEEQIRDSLRRITALRREVWMVKMADRITNLRRPPSTWSKEKKTRYQKDAILIHDQLKEASNLLKTRLAQKIDEYATYI